MSPLFELLGALVADPDRAVAVGLAVAMVAAVVCVPDHVRRRWWAAIRRE